MTLIIDLADGGVLRKGYETIWGGRALSSKIISEKTPRPYIRLLHQTHLSLPQQHWQGPALLM